MYRQHKLLYQNNKKEKDIKKEDFEEQCTLIKTLLD